MKGSLTVLTAVLALFGLSDTARAVPVTYLAVLSGAAEAPPNASPGVGEVKLVIDTDANTLAVSGSFSGLLGVSIAAHIHGPTPSPLTGTAGVLTTVPSLPGFPLGVTSGTFASTFDTDDAATYNPAFVTSVGSVAAAEAALASYLAARRTYFNLHSAVFPGGEIRGFLAPVPIPLPAGLLLIGGALLGLGALGSRRVRSEAA